MEDIEGYVDVVSLKMRLLINLHRIPCSSPKNDFFFFFWRSSAISLGFTTFGLDFCVCDRFLIQPLR